MARSKCDTDGRWFDSDDTLERMNTWLENPLIINKVIKVLAREMQTQYINHFICPNCFQQRVDAVMRENSSQRDILSEDELRYSAPE